ncbi:hypothetical protein RO3G_00606 [Rhizopus delemar RA 99-880]|uniref:Uncharacterized protein n=1 Tax=Rhizopus delemar (strain RA 99-880 / ATCC MYA-4621 / FGSC 9543 / NRRL 43880) TaxID=246409 RepID=I1BI72_RHIO9|nr:hypothetical protein RO3G_00606 [Rhizopus delemar RA 99-880]|eukprot:EIE75902.1 hypothetical protein RO3G_00606 [Rhizopus delemar RA 99-880]
MATPLLSLIGGEAFRNVKTEFEKRIDEFYYTVYTKRWTRCCVGLMKKGTTIFMMYSASLSTLEKAQA